MTETQSLRSIQTRYVPDDIALLTPAERERFCDEDPWLAWELLYRKEPELYERLIAGEHIHPDVLAWLPSGVDRCVEVAAGTGRLTVDLAPRCDELIAVEPAAPLRRLLDERRLPNVQTVEGFFDALPVSTGWADLVVSCSAFTPDRGHGGDEGLAELERIARDLIVFVWPSDVDWLTERGFEYVAFPGDMAVEFSSLDEAVELARIFYPDAVGEIERRGEARVPYDVLGINPPRDLAWKRVRNP